MRTGRNKNYLLKWIEKQQSCGRYVFSLEQIRKDFQYISDVAIKLSLVRLSQKSRIVSIYKGFYLIIPPEYATRGILPPINFIDALMTFVEKPYYVSLLSAAALHGAAHQQPQEFFVITTIKQLPTQKKNIKINYITKKDIPFNLLEKRKTESGYVNISSPSLTAADLVSYNNRVGGINRACTVINELAEAIKPENITKELLDTISVPTIQRLGYIFERIVNQPELAEKLYNLSQDLKKSFYKQPLKSRSKRSGFKYDAKWEIIINTAIELDE